MHRPALVHILPQATRGARTSPTILPSGPSGAPVARPVRHEEGPWPFRACPWGLAFPGHQLSVQAWGPQGGRGPGPSLPSRPARVRQSLPSPCSRPWGHCSGRGGCLLPTRALRTIPGSVARAHLSQGGGHAFSPPHLGPEHSRLVIPSYLDKAVAAGQGISAPGHSLPRVFLCFLTRPEPRGLLSTTPNTACQLH